MTNLCFWCPIFLLCHVCGKPANEADRNLVEYNAALREENARLRKQAIENGLEYGAGRNYVGENHSEGMLEMVGRI